MLPDISSVHIRVPATSANLGSGFDTVGLALEYYDELEFTVNANPDDTAAHIEIHGEGEDTLPRDETHLVVSTFRKACETFGLKRFGFTMVAHNRIPQARGMGSSAEAIVAGIAAAAGFAHRGEINRAAVFDLAAHIEGHPDNVAPAVYGGLTVSYDFEAPEGVGSVGIAGGEPLRRGFHAVNYPVSPDVEAFVFVPDFELSTEKAREALPRQIAHRDAVYNVSRVGLMTAAMNPAPLGADAQAQANALLFAATQDKLHQPYRAPLMPPSTALIAKLRRAGFAAAVSGAGPCVLVLHHGSASDDIAALTAGELASGHWRMLHLPINTTGVQIERR